MKKTLSTLVAFAVISTVALTGCGLTDSAKSNTANTTTNTPPQSNATESSQKETAVPSIHDGVAKLLSISNELKAEIASGDESKIKETGPKLEDTWSSFEDSVKPKYPDLYEKVEKYLDPTIAATKATPLDKQTLSKLNDQLIQTLNELGEKVK